MNILGSKSELASLKDVKERTEQLHRYLDIDAKKVQYEEEQLRTQAPGFWDDQKRAEAQMKLVKGLEKWIKDYEEVRTMADELETAFDIDLETIVKGKSLILFLKSSASIFMR